LSPGIYFLLHLANYKNFSFCDFFKGDLISSEPKYKKIHTPEIKKKREKKIKIPTRTKLQELQDNHNPKVKKHVKNHDEDNTLTKNITCILIFVGNHFRKKCLFEHAPLKKKDVFEWRKSM
jgi:hypothetical protein